ncbi:MFS transporter [bacterium]|nr:MFS transporter [bacterium]
MKINDPIKQAIRVNYFFLAFSLGTFNPYIALFFKDTLGISNIQLGILLLVRPVVALISQVFWGTIIDGHGHRGRWAAILSICAGCVTPLFLLGHSITSLGILFAIWSFFHSPLLSLSDAVAFDYLGHHRRMHLAFLRIFASMGWIIAVLSIGIIYDFWSLKAMFVIFPFGILISALATSRIPREISVGVQKSWQVVHQLMMKRNVLFFLVAVILFETANQMSYQFLSVYGRFLGANNIQIGSIWAVATLSELITMLAFVKVAQKIGIKKILAIGMVVTVFRWTPLAFVNAWWQVIPFQILHAFTLTFGYLGAALFMDLESPAHIRFTAQAFYGMFVVNIGVIFGSFLGGLLSDHWGYGALYGTAGAIAAVASCVLICCVHEPGK